MKSRQSVVIERLQQAQNEHDLEALLACFAPNFQGEHPRHPDRVFQGIEHVRKNWSIIFQDIPDFHAELLRSAVVGDTAWTEWHYFGTRRNGLQLDLRGVVISGIEADRIKWSRLYMEPVQASDRGWSKSLLPTVIAAALIGGFLPSEAIASRNPSTPGLSQESPVLMATAYTDITLPTLQRGDRGSSVQRLQQILLDNGFLGAAAVRLGNPSGAAVDGIFGFVTESAVRDLQQRYDVPVTGEMNPRTWEVLDMQENPYRSPLPWKL